MITRAKDGIFKPRAFSIDTVVPKEPDTVQQALSDLKWKQAIKDEYDALMKNGTWSLVERTPDMNPISTKWIFRIKYKKDGTVERFKTRLVTRGFQQTAGVDFFDTFSPVIKPTTLRVMFSITITKQRSIQQVDINNAFLHGSLKETVFIDQPEGFQDSSKPGLVCKLHKAVYGLKQTPKAWYDTLKKFLVNSGFVHSSVDHCLFHRKVLNKMIMVLSM